MSADATSHPWQAVEFQSHGVTCRARLYRPARPAQASPAASAPPLVVMAHGLGGTAAMSLEAFAIAFTNAGLAALVFDYRSFGLSDGQPRRLLSIRAQVEDYRAALAFARTLPGVDAQRLVLWGTSFSGGHVMALGGEAGSPALDGVVAVVAQCPFTDGLASTRALGLRDVLRVGVRAVADDILAVLGRGPVRIPTAAPGHRAALMTADDAWPGVVALAGPAGPTDVDVTARIGTRIGLYTPGRALRRTIVPTFVAVCENDTVAPARATLRHLAHASPRVQSTTYPYGHFEIYGGKPQEEVAADEVDFLRGVIRGREGRSSTAGR